MKMADRAHRGFAPTNDQSAIRMCLMRGGTSRGPFFLASDLPANIETRNQVLLAAMGSPHPLQVDGLGGGHPLTSKVGIVSPSPLDEVDVDFEFAQLQPNETSVQTTANCGNMLSAVVPFAVESGLIIPDSDSTEVTVRTTNTGLIATITIQTPRVPGRNDRAVRYEGATAIDGVAGTSSPVSIMFVNTAGSIAPSLLPTGNRLDSLPLPDGSQIEATMIDNGQPLVLLRAEDLRLSGSEETTDLASDSTLVNTLEHLRLVAGHRMGMGDVTDKSYPKMTIVAPPTDGGAIKTRSFIPHTVHPSIGVLAALTVATAASTDGTIAFPLSDSGEGELRTLDIEHPSGSFPVDLQVRDNEVIRSGLTRTARLLTAGQVFVPRSIWNSPPTKNPTHSEGTQR